MYQHVRSIYNYYLLRVWKMEILSLATKKRISFLLFFFPFLSLSVSLSLSLSSSLVRLTYQVESAQANIYLYYASNRIYVSFVSLRYRILLFNTWESKKWMILEFSSTYIKKMWPKIVSFFTLHFSVVILLCRKEFPFQAGIENNWRWIAYK